MKVDRLLFGTRDFLASDQIMTFIGNSKNYGDELEQGDTPEALLIFETSKQRTWLVASRERLYCILDDIRQPEPKIGWSISRKELIDQNSVKLSIRTHDKSERTGYVDIGPQHRDWLYSKKLFADRDVAESIRGMIVEKMI